MHIKEVWYLSVPITVLASLNEFWKSQDQVAGMVKGEQLNTYRKP